VIKDGEKVFDEHRSLLFKTLQVVRFYDRERNVLVYVSYSDRVIEGSPKSSISTVCRSWHGRRPSFVGR
jgi:CreA protein